MIIDDIFKKFEDLINGVYDPLKFSVEIPKFLVDNFDEIEYECKGLGDFLEEDVPEICDEGEPGFDPTHMITELKKIYEQAKIMLENKSK